MDVGEGGRVWCVCVCEGVWYGMMKQFSLPPSFAMKDIGLTTVVSLTAIPDVLCEPAVMSRTTYDGLLMPESDETM